MNIKSCLLIFSLIILMDFLLPINSTRTVWSVNEPPEEIASIQSRLDLLDFRAMRMAISDLQDSFPRQYKKASEYLGRLTQYEKRFPHILTGLQTNDPQSIQEAIELLEFQQEALLSNPLLDFGQLLMIKRKPQDDPRRAYGDPENDKGLGKYLGIPQQSSWQLHTIPNPTGWENEIAVLSPVNSSGQITTFYTPPDKELINELDLHFNADRLMFSMPDATQHWQIYEIETGSGKIRQISSDNQPDVHNLDSCYLPNDKIAYISTAPFQGVPCNASVNVGMTYVMDGDGSNVRQICFEQDHNFCPTVMNDGRILYLRWEYTDIPHVWARFLFTMNPDGTSQREYYGSGGYWPNAIFFARPIPNHPTKFVGIVTGHHIGRTGDLAIFDPVLGRNATDGAIQTIPGYGKKVEPLIQDKLTIYNWPKFLHPYPLNDKYFLVSCKPGPNSLWGIYLVDIFDNIVLLKETEGCALLEPLPFRKIQRPPVIPERIDLTREDALIYLENIYAGPGLKDVPFGSIKQLRLFTYHFAYHTIAGINHRVGTDGPWEPKRVLGTVPVEEDGSAFFRVPANTPISIQPLDEQGRALQLMRSWTTAMPGELVSCVGCHEKQNSAPPVMQTVASRKEPVEIEPWHGPVRGFSFIRDVQPVLDKHCVGCHNGEERKDGIKIPDLRKDQGKYICYKNSNPYPFIIEGTPKDQLVLKYGGVFDPSYIALRRMVRVGGLESDLRMLNPSEFNANTSELIQMLAKGHHGVELEAEDWDRLFTWIDLNAPCHGTWHEITGEKKLANNHKRRLDLRTIYGGVIDDPEAIVQPVKKISKTAAPKQPPAEISARSIQCEGWPFDSMEAKRRQKLAARSTQINISLGKPSRTETERSIDLGDGIKLDLTLIPSGQFIMGDPDGNSDEKPLSKVTIDKPFWMGKYEITNEQYAQFDPNHDSRYEHKGSWMFNEWDLGWDLNRPKQPVVRISQQQALEFCRWLSQQTGLKVTLPDESQWEYACRAGTDTPLYYGSLDTDFSEQGNMADWSIRGLVLDCRDQIPPDLVPRDARFNDKQLVSADAGSYAPNAWGLHDMHGNVWEWTRSKYTSSSTQDTVVVRGGSWYDRPKRCRSAFRLSYPAWQKVYNTGFRVIAETGSHFTASSK